VPVAGNCNFKKQEPHFAKEHPLNYQLAFSRSGALS